MQLSLRFVAESCRVVARTFLPTWLFGSGDRVSHGGSRWATHRERDLLGQRSRPERLSSDGIVLGFLDSEVLQSPREDNVLMLGVQRSGKTSAVVVPTLLG